MAIFETRSEPVTKFSRNMAAGGARKPVASPRSGLFGGLGKRTACGGDGDRWAHGGRISRCLWKNNVRDDHRRCACNTVPLFFRFLAILRVRPAACRFCVYGPVFLSDPASGVRTANHTSCAQGTSRPAAGDGAICAEAHRYLVALFHVAVRGGIAAGTLASNRRVVAVGAWSGLRHATGIISGRMCLPTAPLSRPVPRLAPRADSEYCRGQQGDCAIVG